MNEVETQIESDIGIVRLAREEARNAVYPEQLDAVIEAIETFDSDDSIRAIVFGGKGDAFCAGADRRLFLAKLPGKSATEIQDDIYRRFMGVARALHLASKPTIAMVNGAAVGAGCEFAVACDFRIASNTALFWENWIDLGIIPPLGGMYLLPRIVGMERASEMVLCARKVNAEEALAWGLVSRVVEPGMLEQEATTFAHALARRSSRAMSVGRKAMRQSQVSSLEAHWDFTLQAQSLLLSGPDFAEAVAAMDEKRAPRFA